MDQREEGIHSLIIIKHLKSTTALPNSREILASALMELAFSVRKQDSPAAAGAVVASCM